MADVGFLIVNLPRGPRGSPLFRLVLARLFAALLLHGSPLLNARVVAFELDPRVWRETEGVFHNLTVANHH